MPWNWQLRAWPKFTYDKEKIAEKEKRFLLAAGGITAFLKKIEKPDYNKFIIEVLSQEATDSSKIEGEILDRESLQSSLKRHFGININRGKKEGKKEAGMAEMMCDIYDSFQQQLSNEILWKWHALLFKDQSHIEDTGRYRTHLEPMQIVSHRIDRHKVFFEAPPSEIVPREMSNFVNWFNSTYSKEPVLARAAIAHVYFESIHPFEDGNGRIGRVLIEKVLSQEIGRPALIAVSKVLEQRKKEYYEALEKCNHTLEITPWVIFFSDVILQAIDDSRKLLNFLIEKSRLLTSISNLINPRQEKAILRLCESGPSGFKGGMSAENYISITKTSRATATRDLAELVKIGALKKTGELRHTRYWLNIS